MASTKLSHRDLTSIDPFNTTSMTAGIILTGQMTPILVRSLLLPTADASHKMLNLDTIRTLARETDVAMVVPNHDAWKDDLDCLYAADWLLVCAPSTPTVIGGWVLLDDVQHQQQLDSYEGTVLLALHISTRRKVGTTDKSQDFVTRRRAIGRDVYEVLLVEPQEGNRYRRVGVGRIFDSQLIADIGESDRMEIELV